MTLSSLPEVKNVASIVRPLEYTLSGLSDDEFWSIIVEKAFDGNDEVPPVLEIIGKKIAEACQGLPLAANVVGGVLRRYKSEEEWRLISVNCLSDAEGRGIMKQKVIEQWMSEGFLQPDERNEMEDVGNKFFNVLVHNSLMHVVARDDHGNVQVCVMHNLVHDLASFVLSNSADGSTPVREILYIFQIDFCYR
ncbi:hypothetical protein SASPL_134149 [Salvia splendens]|uniref:Disease resistance protein winged helix domain-containing protein n=1 Tax=Salvia splendens TaxID=180675 RepID=A0A8X8X2L4_SALSN|nr:hypothetical protein SASPL_134149 [Salvia splendens]